MRVQVGQQYLLPVAGAFLLGCDDFGCGNFREPLHAASPCDARIHQPNKLPVIWGQLPGKRGAVAL